MTGRIKHAFCSQTGYSLRVISAELIKFGHLTQKGPALLSESS